MKKVFLSEKNIANQTKKLITYLNLEPDELNRNTIINCKKIIMKTMDATFDKYGEKKPEDMSVVEFLDKINKKSLSDCLKIFDGQKEIKMSNNPQVEKLRDSSIKKKPASNQFGLQPNNTQYMRPNEMMNKMKNPQNTQHPEQMKNPSKEYQSYADAGGFASFSSIDNASGPFITATGEYGLPIEMQNTNGQFAMQSTNDGKKNYADEIQQKMDALRYQGGYGGNQQMQQPTQQQVPMEILQKFLPNVDISASMGQQQPPQQQQLQQYGGQQQQYGGGQQQQMNPMAQFSQLNQMMNQMQQSGQLNPQMMQMLMGQMQMLMAQMQKSQQPQMQQIQQMQQQPQMQQQQMQQPQQQMQQQQPQQQMQQSQQGGLGFDYSFNSVGENMGNDFNSAYTDKKLENQSNNYDGIDSLNSVYQHNSITEPIKNLSEQTGDLGNALEKMKAERERVNSGLGNGQKPTNFNPMVSPSQMTNNQNQQYNDSFFF